MRRAFLAQRAFLMRRYRVPKSKNNQREIPGTRYIVHTYLLHVAGVAGRQHVPPPRPRPLSTININHVIHLVHYTLKETSTRKKKSATRYREQYDAERFHSRAGTAAVYVLKSKLSGNISAVFGVHRD